MSLRVRIMKGKGGKKWKEKKEKRWEGREKLLFWIMIGIGYRDKEFLEKERGNIKEIIDKVAEGRY